MSEVNRTTMTSLRKITANLRMCAAIIALLTFGVGTGHALVSQTITFGAIAGRTYGAAPFAVSATASSGLAVTFTSSTPAVCTVSASTVTIVAAGTCTIAANQAGNATYSAAAAVTQSFAVAKAALALKPVASWTYCTSSTATSAFAVGGLVNGDTTSVLSGGYTMNWGTVSSYCTTVGTYAITVATSTIVASNYTISYVAGTLTIAKAALTITPAFSRAYGMASASGTLQVSGLLNGETPSVLSGTQTGFSSATTVTSPVGTYPITIVGGTYTATNYSVSYGTGVLTVTKAPLTVTANSVSRAYGSANPALSSTITGYMNSETSSVLSGTAPTLSTTATNASPVATYPITLANGTYAATNYSITYTNGTLTVTQAPLTVTAGSASRVYGAANPAFSSTITGYVNGDTASVLSGAATLTTTATPTSAVATYAITPALGTLAASNYSFIFANGTLTVTKAALTVSAVNNRTYGAANALTPTFTGFVNGDSATVLSGAPALSTTATAASAVGSYAIAVSGTYTATNYSIAYTGGTLTVTKAALTLTAASPSRVYGTANPALTSSITGYMNGDTASVLSGTAPTLATTAAASSPAGSYAITVTAGTYAASNYSINYVNGTLTVTKALLTVTANASRAYGAANAISASFSGFVNSDTASVLTGAPTLTTTATSASGIGSYPISVAQGTLAASNYSFTCVNGTLTIAPAVLTVTANSASRPYGAANPALTATISGFANGENSSVVIGSETLTTTATPTSNAGTYAIAVTQGTLMASNYSFTYVNGILTVTKAPLTVTANNVIRPQGAANPTLTTTITGYLNGDTSSALTGAALLSTTATTSSVNGSYPITVAAGTLAAANYSFTCVNGTLTVGKAGPVITWPAPATIAFGTALSATQLNATASVAGTFVYSPAAGSVPTVGAKTLSATFTPSDSTNYSVATATVPLTVEPALTISTSSLPSGTMYSAYSTTTLAAAGGQTPYTWTATGLPYGLMLSAGGAITGIPFTSGTSSVTVKVTDAANVSTQAILSIAIASSTASPSTGSVAYTYDSQGRVTQALYTVGASKLLVTYTYDSVGNRTQWTTAVQQ